MAVGRACGQWQLASRRAVRAVCAPTACLVTSVAAAAATGQIEAGETRPKSAKSVSTSKMQPDVGDSPAQWRRAWGEVEWSGVELSEFVRVGRGMWLTSLSAALSGFATRGDAAALRFAGRFSTRPGQADRCKKQHEAGEPDSVHWRQARGQAHLDAHHRSCTAGRCGAARRGAVQCGLER